jgi:hypothetical protein
MLPARRYGMVRTQPQKQLYFKCYVVRTVHFGMKLYNDQRNAQVFKFILFIYYFCLTSFGLSFSPLSEGGVQHWQWFKTAGYGVSALAPNPT